MEISGTALILLILLVVSVLFLVGGCGLTCSSRSGFTFNNSEYQYSNPNVYRQWYYYKCLEKDCGGDTHDYDCLEKCHLKAYRMDMDSIDVKDWVCMPYAKDEDAFYRCLDSVYADYRYP
jgi:hypothetical protein